MVTAKRGITKGTRSKNKDRLTVCLRGEDSVKGNSRNVLDAEVRGRQSVLKETG